MKGTEDMPEPQTLNYDQMLKISQKFVDDVMGILTNQPYVEVHDMIKMILHSGYILPISAVNEIVQRVSKFPYNYVKDFMNVVETKQGEYFSAAPVKQPEQQKETIDPNANVDESLNQNNSENKSE